MAIANKTTKKLFYKKFSDKVVIRMRGMWYARQAFRYKGKVPLADALGQIRSLNREYSSASELKIAEHNLANIVTAYYNFIGTGKPYRIGASYWTFTLFLDNAEDFLSLLTPEIKKLRMEVWTPAADERDKVMDGVQIVGKQLKDFTHKVSFNKMEIQPHLAKQIVGLIDNLPEDEVKISPQFKRRLERCVKENYTMYAYGKYIYLKDLEMATMLALMLPTKAINSFTKLSARE